MSGLPAELESLVCSFLSIADLKAARLVNKRWSDIAAPFLFEEIWIAQATFQKLEDVSCHKSLRFHVKKIVLSILPVPVIPPVTWQGWDGLRFHMDPEKFATRLQQYQFLYDEQERFAASDLGGATMRRAIDRLPQLLCLDVGEIPPIEIGMKYFVPPVRSPCYFDDLAIFQFVYGLNELTDINDTIQFMSNTLRGLFQTLSGRKIKHFHPGCLAKWYFTKPTQLMLGLALFEHLKTLDLQIRSVIDVDEHMSGLQTTLSKIPCLEKLVLNFETGRALARSDVFDGFSPSLPKLEHFEICGSHTTEASLTSLLTHFIGSLRRLRLDTVSLIDQPLEQHSTSWSRMLSIFVSEDCNLARVTLKKLSYFHPDKWSKTWLTTQCLLSIQDKISHKAALPKTEAYDNNSRVDRYTDNHYLV